MSGEQPNKSAVSSTEFVKNSFARLKDVHEEMVLREQMRVEEYIERAKEGGVPADKRPV